MVAAWLFLWIPAEADAGDRTPFMHVGWVYAADVAGAMAELGVSAAGGGLPVRLKLLRWPNWDRYATAGGPPEREFFRVADLLTCWADGGDGA